ncbi:MAG: cell division protein FtsQ/DivIB [Alphaproteobacteria bacterium]|nr:cell division protein FtsQ/DivIB [Alphaproteobacteria bacterium]
MKKSKTPLRGSVTQNNMSARVQEQDGIGFLARLGLLLGFLLFVVVSAVYGWHRGWPQREAGKLRDYSLSLTKNLQFSVKDIQVEGRVQSDKDAIFDALGIARGAPIFSLDPQGAAERLGKLSWVGSVIVERRLPDTIAVILTERAPTARWQHDEKLYVIDDKGQILQDAKPENFAGLPLVVGVGAENAAQNLFALLKKYPDIRKRTDAAVRVGERRWDLHLASKVTVKLPEENVESALHRLSVLIAQEKILDRNIVAIDLRLPDRLVIDPAPDAKPTGTPHL